MPRTAYTLPLPGLSTTDGLDTVINWGLGADSTAYLAKMLSETATASWPSTCRTWQGNVLLLPRLR